ncbi:hypothetical protein Trydic_g474 [Trypoxylus dichotomus]
MAYTVVKETTKQWKDKRSQNWWNSIPGWKQAKKFLVGYRPSFTVLDLLCRDRKSVRTIVSLPTERCMLRKLMSNLDPTEETIYRFCQAEEETAIRVLCDDTALARIQFSEIGSEYLKAETYVNRKGSLTNCWV